MANTPKNYKEFVEDQLIPYYNSIAKYAGMGWNSNSSSRTISWSSYPTYSGKDLSDYLSKRKYPLESLMASEFVEAKKRTSAMRKMTHQDYYKWAASHYEDLVTWHVKPLLERQQQEVGGS